MEIELNTIKSLREKTGAGVTNCKKALIEAGGNFENAFILLREKGFVTAEKKNERCTRQGVIASYIHTGARIGALVELNCETDFVARKIEFKNLATDLAMQIVANNNIKYIALKDIPQFVWDLEFKNATEQMQQEELGKVLDKSSIQAKVEKMLQTYTLYSQPYIRDISLSIEEYIKNQIFLFGENIKIKRFSKFEIGEEN